ncbi:galactitol-1-phosphate 5-dehydrogenase [Enterococcus florum]|uniref:Galactitol-1-phosphate 5-dehydrogenase n=1 Tax=Enterococcus florum TaxID=2480627 RepID=A0A4V0WP99_9ENTE|nr:galactitol-1-phosphate 5-dehydrogenase [Enterococcus florum]GCF93119.1 galactitol-1-phosphate 5-dehydrogenase [Enterococcus florum]
MNALKLYAKRDLRFEEQPYPKIEKGTDVIIQIKAAGICGSDISRYKKQGPYVPGMVWGHEFSGIVVETGSQVKEVTVGSRISGVPTLTCEDQSINLCRYCRKGEYARCEQLTVVGAYYPGGFAEYIKLPEKNCVLLPDSVDLETAAMLEPAAVVQHGLFHTNLTIGDTVVVVGCGTIGLLAIQLSVIYGARRVIAVDISETSLHRAQANGATVLINGRTENILQRIIELTEGDMGDVVVEAAGSIDSSAQVFAYAKKGGGVVFLGIPYSDIQIERFYFEKIVRNELTIWGSWNSVSAPFPGKEWETIIHLIEKKKLQPERLITHRIKLQEGPKIFEELMKEETSDSFGKILFVP